MNILILSVGTRNKIIQYFKNTLNGNIIVTDMDEFAPALYEADKFYIVPSINAPEYIDVILNICRKEKIKGVLSLIDPELSLIEKNRKKFENIGTIVIGSSYELCEMALDKFEMFKWLKTHKYKCAKSYLDKDEFYLDIKKGIINYPVIIKPVRGSASISLSKVYDKESIDLLFTRNEELMIQEFFYGQEIGADVYVDILSGEVISIFTKYKIKMRAGETDKAISFKDNKLFDLISTFVKEAGFRGEIDIDIFKINDEYYISEVNPRFGGGYPHAFECGINNISFIINNLNGIKNIPQIGKYEENIVMMKYNEIIVKKFKGNK